MMKTADLIWIDEHGLEREIAKITMSGAYEPSDKEIFTLNFYDKKVPVILIKEAEDKEKITILYGENLPKREITGEIDKVYNYKVLKKLL